MIDVWMKKRATVCSRMKDSEVGGHCLANRIAFECVCVCARARIKSWNDRERECVWERDWEREIGRKVEILALDAASRQKSVDGLLLNDGFRESATVGQSLLKPNFQLPWKKIAQLFLLLFGSGRGVCLKMVKILTRLAGFLKWNVFAFYSSSCSPGSVDFCWANVLAQLVTFVTRGFERRMNSESLLIFSHPITGFKLAKHSGLFHPELCSQANIFKEYL